MMATTSITINAEQVSKSKFRILVCNEHYMNVRFDPVDSGFYPSKLSGIAGKVIPLPWAKSAIKPVASWNVVEYMKAAGHSGPLIVPKMEFEPQLGDVITFGTSRVWYTIISLDTIEPHIVMLDRPLEESLQANRAGVVVEPVVLQTRFRPAKHGHFINRGMVCGVSILDERLACVMLA